MLFITFSELWITLKEYLSHHPRFYRNVHIDSLMDTLLEKKILTMELPNGITCKSVNCKEDLFDWDNTLLCRNPYKKLGFLETYHNKNFFNSIDDMLSGYFFVRRGWEYRIW